MRRRWKSIAVVIALLTVGAGFAWAKWPRDSASPASVHEALSSFRSGVEGAQRRRPGLPSFGVYLYRTDGSEKLDTAVFGGTHDYRGRSTITVAPSPCGVRERWQVLTGRWNDSAVCQAPDGRLRATFFGEHHEFFGTASAASYPCRHSDEPEPRDYRIGLRWTISCSDSEGSVRFRSRVVAFRPIEVDGEPVPAFKIASRVRIDGEVSGASFVSDWRRRSDGLLLYRTVDTTATVDVIGGGSYGEKYSLAILSTVPRK